MEDEKRDAESGSDGLDKFLWRLNGHERKIQFTLERETDNFLPFLDIGITRTNTGCVTKVYRKETHTQKYFNWRSNHSKNCLLGVLKGLIHRAHQLCDLKNDLIDELQLLKDVFVSNGYPIAIGLVEKTIKDSWKTETMKNINELLKSLKR